VITSRQRSSGSTHASWLAVDIASLFAKTYRGDASRSAPAAISMDFASIGGGDIVLQRIRAAVRELRDPS
jgi:hypothetical protein